MDQECGLTCPATEGIFASTSQGPTIESQTPVFLVHKMETMLRS